MPQRARGQAKRGPVRARCGKRNENSMKVLLAAQWLGGVGGMERFIDIVTPAIAARGVTLRTIARQIDKLPDGMDAQLVRWSDEHDAPDEQARAQTERVIAEFQPDVALAENVMDYGVVEALRGAPRFVYHIHDHRPFCPNGDRVFPRTGRNCTLPLGNACAVHALLDGCAYGPRRRTLELIRRREKLRDAIAAADSVIVASRYVAERAISNGIDAGRIGTIVNPLPDEAYSESVELPENRVVVFVGRIVPQKGLASLVRALGHIEPPRRPLLRVFGDGSDRDNVVRIARELQVELDLRGVTGAHEVRAGIDSGRLVAMPSLWAEPFGIAGTEALARGRPVVAYDAGGVEAWLRDGENGVAVRAGDERALGHAIADLLDDPQRCARMAARAREDAERFRLEPCVDAIVQLLSGPVRA